MRTLARKFTMLAAVGIIGAAALSVAPAAADDDGGRKNNCAGNGDRYGQNRDGRGGRLDVVGLTADQRLICFRENNPERARDVGDVSGLMGDTMLLGIDYRPANGMLYGVGNAGGLYTIDPATAAGTKVAQLTVALAGTSFGVDVNPAADALRIISDTGQNLRFSFATGATFTDTPLAYPPNAATGVVGAAYTNNDADPNTATTLFDLDSMLDQVAIQSPANSGQLVATGKLSVDTSGAVGFDIYSTIRGGTTVEVRALASLTVDGRTRLYEVSLLTGKATELGHFDQDDQLIGLAIPLAQR